MKFVVSIFVFLIHTSDAMAYGKVFPTRSHLTTISRKQYLIVKNVSDISEFSELVYEEDDTRRLLELREGIAILKAKQIPRLTFRCMCGTTYDSVFGSK